MSKPNLCVVGNGMVGHTLLESLVAGGAHNTWNILVFCEEPRVAYNRMALSEYFKGRTAEDLSLVKDNMYEQYGIKVLIGELATAIDPVNKIITSSSGPTYPYDKLVLATGSFPFVPPVPGSKGPGCFVYRTIEDLQAIQEFAKRCTKGVVVGGGLLGLEAAQAMLNMGLETHVVEFAPRLMAVQLDEAAGSVLLRHVQKMGVHVHVKKNTTQVVCGGEKVEKMVFADGGELETEMIVFSAGIRPRDQVARCSGINVGPRGGVEINDYCQTNYPDVYAIGEVALHKGRIYGLVSPGNQMARVCADHILGKDGDAFEGADMSTKLKIVGCDVAVIGDSLGNTPNCESFTISQTSKGIYKKVSTNSTLDKVVGGIFVGDATEYNTVLSIMLNDLPVPAEPESLILPQIEGGGGAALGSVQNLPDKAKVCSCHNVSKGDLVCAIKDGALEMDDLKSCTKAGTGCGGCVPMVKELLDFTKASMGIETTNYVCEHFKMTRQELCHSIMVKQLPDFKSVITELGTGMGCEICKPAVASILAQTFGDNIHRVDLAVLQDTNDYFLANMQRDGTYSVVPRTAGGEIHPKQLETLGAIGSKYGLYTKITGGQRVDFFGAQTYQLPKIWADLTAEGFESGHAYGKALRTVKSCVGSTWCRYGVQDSVGMAVDLENRYKGIRMPHKFKMGVSGCTRECAEAQGKDVGLIAVKGGYNVYVCGNGGMKPKHAELLATDLSEAEAVKLIDRFIMFYCRTADRLQRTARWLENLEGGMDYLKKVLIEDSLGINAELEKQLQMLVDGYQNEWETAIKNPEQCRRFVNFINLPDDQQHDETLVYQHERGQIRLPVLTPANPYPLPEPAAKPAAVFNGGGTAWADVCKLDIITPESGVCAKVDGVQIAVFRIQDSQVYALSNFDPFADANVISRGIVGDKAGVLKVASPLYKHNFALETGVCLSKPDVVIPRYPVQVVDGMVQVKSTPISE
jgi:nitrite reductase (NADH) large subunit